MIHNEAEAIRAKLAGIEGVASVTRGWPKSFAHLPCIAVTKAADAPADYRDDRAQVYELEYYIRVFADKADEADAVAAAVDACMEALGYARTFAYDDDNPEVRMQAQRYRKFV